MVLKLARSVNSICSPFDKEGEFKVNFKLLGNVDWLKNLMSVKTIMESALFRAHCEISDEEINYSYEFEPYPAMREVSGRKHSYIEKASKKIHPEVIKSKIGNFTIDLNIFDREPAVLELGVTDQPG